MTLKQRLAIKNPLYFLTFIISVSWIAYCRRKGDGLWPIVDHGAGAPSRVNESQQT
jgi:hypothetical protein